MINLRFISAALISVLTCAFNSDAQSLSVVSDNGDNLVVDIYQENVKDKKAIETAIPFLCNTLMFRGIPDTTSCHSPLAGTDEDAFVENNADYFDKLINGRFTTFLTSARLVSYTKKHKLSVTRFNVNIRALRLDLESQGVKRRFGF